MIDEHADRRGRRSHTQQLLHTQQPHHGRDWSAFALLLIDVQRDFWTPAMPAAFALFESNVAKLLSDCREEGIDILHVQAEFNPDQRDWMPLYKLKGDIPCVAGTPGCEPLSCAEPQPGEAVFTKSCFDAMLAPGLAYWLATRKKRCLLIAGLETSVCVLLTAASAAQAGYLTVVLEDACADEPEAHAFALAHYEGKAFLRATHCPLSEQHAAWTAQLNCLDVV